MTLDEALSVWVIEVGMDNAKDFAPEDKFSTTLREAAQILHDKGRVDRESYWLYYSTVSRGWTLTETAKERLNQLGDTHEHTETNDV